MLYAILCYDSEDVVGGWSKAEDDEVMDRLVAVTEDWAQLGKLGPVARLLPTTAATTLRRGREPLVIDGPFAETKEQLLGFFVIDCENLEEAIAETNRLAEAKHLTVGSYEIRPVGYYHPGGPVS
jgi:hypothetical protein